MENKSDVFQRIVTRRQMNAELLTASNMCQIQFCHNHLTGKYFNSGLPALPSIPNIPLTQSVSETMPIPAVIDRKPVDTSLINYAETDPVTKAVMDNIMGTLSTNKQGSLKCEICGLEFSASVVLDTHLAGAKHAKKVKSLEILKSLQNSGQSFSRDDKTRILRCEVCDILVNSSQQLQTHLSGNKHKQKLLKTNGGSTPTNDSEGGTTNYDNQGFSGDGSQTSNIPSGVQKLPNSSSGKVSKYFCDTCNICVNSEIQLEQHLSSRKHKDKASGKKILRSGPYWKKQRPSFQQSSKPSPRLPMPLQYAQPLSSNFLRGSIMKGNVYL